VKYPASSVTRAKARLQVRLRVRNRLAGLFLPGLTKAQPDIYYLNEESNSLIR